MRMLLLIALAACSAAVLAERADKDQPTIIEADRGVFDELKQVNVVSGRATLNRGTMRITGERMELRTAPDGYRSALVTGAADTMATFRQRRDPTRPGVEEYVEGTAERIEWDERTESVRFVNKAQWRRLENGVVRDEITGQVISYDAAASTYRIEGGEQGGGRVRAVIAPRTTESPKAPPAPLRPATEPPAGKK